MSVLALETSTTHGSVVVLAADGTVTFEESFVADRTHSSFLFAALERAKAVAPPWDRIAVGLGPGSYAGVRIALSAAMGLSLVSGAKLLGIPSIAALDVEASRYAAIGDARQESFYWSVVENGVCLEGPEIVTPEVLRIRLGAMEGPLFASDFLAIAPHAQPAHPSALRLARFAYAGRGIVARGELEPIYLREPHITRPKPVG